MLCDTENCNVELQDPGFCNPHSQLFQQRQSDNKCGWCGKGPRFNCKPCNEKACNQGNIFKMIP